MLWCSVGYAIELKLELMGTDTVTTRRLKNLRDWNPKYSEWEMQIYRGFEKKLSAVKSENMYSSFDWRILGIANWIDEDFNKSVDCFRNALKKSPDNEETIRMGLWLSRALFKAEEYAEAIQIDNLLRPNEFREEVNK